jgi:hypothetical protein
MRGARLLKRVAYHVRGYVPQWPKLGACSALSRYREEIVRADLSLPKTERLVLCKARGAAGRRGGRAAFPGRRNCAVAPQTTQHAGAVATWRDTRYCRI